MGCSPTVRSILAEDLIENFPLTGPTRFLTATAAKHSDWGFYAAVFWTEENARNRPDREQITQLAYGLGDYSNGTPPVSILQPHLHPHSSSPGHSTPLYKNGTEAGSHHPTSNPTTFPPGSSQEAWWIKRAATTNTSYGTVPRQGMPRLCRANSA